MSFNWHVREKPPVIGGRLLLYALGCAAVLVSGSAHAGGQPGAEARPGLESGNDLIREKGRFDIRTEISEEEGEEAVKFTSRVDQPYRINERWSVNFRADLPLVDAPAAADGIDLRDVLLQAVLVRRTAEDQAGGFGLQVIIPASPDREWRIRPSVGYRWPVSGFPSESFFQLTARYDWGLGGNGADANRSELQFAPTLEIGLRDDIYLSLFPSTDIRYDFNSDSLFIPLNVEIGADLGERIVASLEGAAALVEGDAPPYQWKVEGRIGIRF